MKKKAAETEQTGGRAFTLDNWEELQRISALGLQVHLDIESFYVFANILLDRIASTFRYYFSRRPDWNEQRAHHRGCGTFRHLGENAPPCAPTKRKSIIEL